LQRDSQAAPRPWLRVKVVREMRRDDFVCGGRYWTLVQVTARIFLGYVPLTACGSAAYRGLKIVFTVWPEVCRERFTQDGFAAEFPTPA
jgi:hypothetical protein